MSQGQVAPVAQRVLVTGGAGFIGSALVRYLVSHDLATVLNIDKLTYAGNLASLAAVSGQAHYQFLQADIGDPTALASAVEHFRPTVVMHLAAESHVDRSIDAPAPFIHTNIVGTYQLLQCVLEYWNKLPVAEKDSFRLHHISTDEVFGSLGSQGKFTEKTPYAPRSPYSASKAGSDHLVRSWFHTYGLPVLLTNCSNNYGPYQFPEKLVPLMILQALDGQALPVYGQGDQIRDWLFVEDHVRGLWQVVQQGEPGRTYNLGGNAERTNLAVVTTICDLLDELRPSDDGTYRQLIRLVPDRPGHDQRYAMDTTRITQELGWHPQETFASGLRKTVAWYLENAGWWQPIREKNYAGERLGKRC